MARKTAAAAAVPPIFDETVSRILCPVPLTGDSSAPLRTAVMFAHRFKAQLHLLHVVEFVPGLALYSKADVQKHVRRMHEKIDALLDAESGGVKGGLDVRTAVECGNAAEKILEYIKQHRISLTVIGTHERGYGFMERALLGSTAEKVVRYSPMPVLTVRAEPPAAKRK